MALGETIAAGWRRASFPQGLGKTIPLPVSKAPEPQIAPIVEDYSDIAFDEDDKLEEKVADFKVRRSRAWLHIPTHMYGR